jgi:hypothetical protein
MGMVKEAVDLTGGERAPARASSSLRSYSSYHPHHQGSFVSPFPLPPQPPRLKKFGAQNGETGRG